MRNLLLTLLVLLILAATAHAEDEGQLIAEPGNNPGEPSGAGPAPAGKQDGDFVIEKRGGQTIKYKKKTSYDFEGANIDGLYNKPSGSYISNIKDVKAKSIIRIRENFDAEVIDSSRLLK